jgi:type III secretion protein T
MLSLILELQEKLATIALMYARIVPIFMVLPVLKSGVLHSTFLRNTVIFTIIVGLWPEVGAAIPRMELATFETLALAAKEVVIGASIGFILTLPFWIFDALGDYIDVARGSSMGSLLDPTTGQESTEIQNFVNFSICAVYLQLGGMRLLLETLVQSYRAIALDQYMHINFDLVAKFIGQLFERGFILASPVLLTLLLTEALLGLLSRFTPQLNAFSVAITIKSTIAIAILSLYFWQVLPDQLSQFMNEYSRWDLVTP